MEQIVYPYERESKIDKQAILTHGFWIEEKHVCSLRALPVLADIESSAFLIAHFSPVYPQPQMCPLRQVKKKRKQRKLTICIDPNRSLRGRLIDLVCLIAHCTSRTVDHLMAKKNSLAHKR